MPNKAKPKLSIYEAQRDKVRHRAAAERPRGYAALDAAWSSGPPLTAADFCSGDAVRTFFKGVAARADGAVEAAAAGGGDGTSGDTAPLALRDQPNTYVP